jgi:type I restriction enzyme R subunit
LKAEVVVDRDALDQGQFKAQGGGFARLNKVFDGKLEQVLGLLHEELWRDVG